MDQGLETGAKVVLSGRAARTFWRAFIAFFVLSTIAIIVLGEIALKRWAPWASNAGMSALVAMVWMYHFVGVFRRERPIIAGVGRAVVVCLVLSALIVGSLYVVR